VTSPVVFVQQLWSLWLGRSPVVERTSVLPSLDSPASKEPVAFRYVRELEGFEGAILSELASENGSGCFVEKYCTQGGGTTQWLVMESRPQTIEAYLAGEITMLELLGRHATTWVLVERRGPDEVGRRPVVLAELPASYLPKEGVFHDPELRPGFEEP
jgi:hypothetical protein